MSFTQKTWKDRISEYPTRRTLTNTSTSDVSTVTVAREEGTISQQGDAFSAANMNDLENRVGIEFSTINSNLDDHTTFPSSQGGFYPDYQNGVMGYNTSPERGADTFSPFSSIELLWTHTTESYGATETVTIPNLSNYKQLIILAQYFVNSSKVTYPIYNILTLSSTITPATITSLYDGGWNSNISTSLYIIRYVSISGDTISFYSPQTSANQAAYTHPYRIWGTKSIIFDNTFA